MLMRRYDEAIAGYCDLVALDPTFYKGYTAMGRCYALMGRYSEAIAMLERGWALAGDIPNVLAAMAQIHAMAGNERRARQLLDDLTELGRTGYVSNTCFAIIHIGLGETARALDWLEKGFQGRDLPMCNIKVHPIYDPLRGEPRFETLLRQMRLVT
jgi:serine/threonine-protein kinase